MEWTECIDNLTLRLDSKMYFYQSNTSGFKLLEAYSIHNGPLVLETIGTYNQSHGIQVPEPDIWTRRSNLRGVHLVNGVMFWRAFNIVKTDSNGNIIEVDGPMHTILKHLASKLNFTFANVQSRDRKWGKAAGNESDGFVWDQMDGYMDICTGGLTISLQRSEAIDFSIPIATGYTTLIIPKTQGRQTQFWVYLEIFPTHVWICIMITGLLLGIAFSLTQPGFPFMKGLAFAGLQVLQIGGTWPMKKLSGKILFVTCCSFAYLIFTYYTSDLTARITSGPPQNAINSLRDVIRLGYQVSKHIE